MDDTLFDHSLTCRDALAGVRHQFPALRGRPVDELWREYGRLLGETHRGVMLGLRTSEEARAERFLRLAAWAGRPVAASSASEMADAYRVRYQAVRRAVPGAPEAVRQFKQHSLIAVVTNNTVSEQEEKLAFLGLDRTVDYLITSEEVGLAKPDPGIFRAALRRTGTPPRETVMVGDAWESDIAGALGAGLRAVWFNRFRAPRPGPAIVPEFRSFRSIRQLASLVAPT
jgi:HAD superfamily hydrolase (TIGR01549 family)